MSVPPQRTEILERERRWMRPAGVAAIYGALAIQVGFYLYDAALDGDGKAERLLEASKGDADGQLLLGVLIAASGFLALAIPLTLFFLAARARSDRVLRQLVALPAIGAVMIAGGLVLNNQSFLDGADNFAASEAKREATPSESAATGDQKAGGNKPGAGADAGESGAAETGKSGGGEEAAKTGEATVEATTTGAETTTTEASEAQSSEDAEDEANDRADDALKDASGASAAALLFAVGRLAFAIGFFYTSLWCMRTGLFTRFWGSLGIASAVVLALLFLYFFALVWFLAMGLMLLGTWIGGRPPAWEAGIAIPWPKPGEPPADARDPLAGQDRDAVEGRGRDVSGDDQGGDDFTGPDGPDELPPGEPGPGGEPPRKRKRRQ